MIDLQKTLAVVVTGASRGIGEACAIHLDRLGFQVFATVRREADGEALKRKSSGKLVPVLMDVTDAGSVACAAAMAAVTMGEAGLAGLVNNAGIAIAGPLEFLPVDKIREQFEVNVLGQITVTQAFLPLLRRGQGRVVNIGSMEGRVAMPFVGPYCASKFALRALTDSLRLELRPWGIWVSLVEPGVVATDALERSIAVAEEGVRQLPPQAQELYSAAIAAGRRAADKIVGTPMPADAVARVVAHALMAKRPKARYVVGRDALAMAILGRFVPDRIRDWVMLRQMGLTSFAHYSPNTLAGEGG